MMSISPVQELDIAGALLLEGIAHSASSLHLQLAADQDGARVRVKDAGVIDPDDVRQAHPPIQSTAQAATGVKVVGAVDKVAGGIQDVHAEVVVPSVPETPDTITDLLQLSYAVGVRDNRCEATRKPAGNVCRPTVDREPDLLPAIAADLCIDAEEPFSDNNVLGRGLLGAQCELRDDGRHVGLHAAGPQLALEVLGVVVGDVQLLLPAPPEHVGHGEDRMAPATVDQPVGPELVRRLGPGHLGLRGPVQWMPPRRWEYRCDRRPGYADLREHRRAHRGTCGECG
mmetsp:Transcript_86929/g.210893  ORF Transcript_86929/g.210893 Transcript_86929/m.210893 type:complete len:285 (-) Transcript_86929:1346-2200(-)